MSKITIPENFLPLTQYGIFSDYPSIDSKNDKRIKTSNLTKKEIDYIVQACNSFPKVVKLLERAKIRIWNDNKGERTEFYYEIDDFLKSLEK